MGGKMRIRVLLSVNRFMLAENTKEIVDLALKYKEAGNKYVVGIELSGDPRVGSFSTYKPELQRAKEAGLKISLHCAETKEQIGENVEMIEFLPHRLGHCCYLVIPFC
jgi:adenosine deaminase